MDTATQVGIRWMIRRDMKEVLAIEYDNYDFPWLEEDFLQCLRQRNCIGMVAEPNGTFRGIVGFMVYELHKDHLELINLAVSREYQRCGIGRQMIEKLASKLKPQRRTQIVTLVSEANYAAQKFFQATGFLATGTIREHFEVNREDAYRMVYDITEAE